MASEATPLVTSVSFLFTLSCSATFGGLPEEGGKDLLGAALLWIGHHGRGVCLGAAERGGTNGLKVADTFWSQSP